MFCIVAEVEAFASPDMICEQFISVATSGTGLKDAEDMVQITGDDYVYSAITPKRFSNATMKMDPFEATRNALESLLTNLRGQRNEAPYMNITSYKRG